VVSTQSTTRYRMAIFFFFFFFGLERFYFVKKPCEFLHAFPFNAMLTVACHTPGDEKPRTTLAKTLEQLIEFCL
jgi:hypothetical protein